MTIGKRKSVFPGLALALALAGVLATDGLAASPKICTRPIDGEWTIVSFTSDDVAAVSPQDARKKVGLKVIISKDTVTFPPDTCQVAREKRAFASKEDKSLFPSLALHPLNISFDCSNNVDMQSFDVGEDCNYIYSSFDGINYKLRRKK